MTRSNRVRAIDPDRDQFRQLSDPTFLASQSREEVAALRAARAAYMARSEAPLVQALREAGHDVKSVYDLVNCRSSYPSAIPVLVEHMSGDYPARIREGIGRALATRLATESWEAIKEMYEDEDDNGAQQGFACALAANATAERVKELMALVHDPTRGDSRGLLLPAIEKYGDRTEVDIFLESLASDKVLSAESRRRLRKRKSSARG